LEVQEFIKDIFGDFEPTPEHDLITSFRWKAIVTTNYDTLVEQAYKRKRNRFQDLVPLIDNGDRIDKVLSGKNVVPLLKLHGCITRINNPSCPLILSKDQYISFQKGRENIFNHFMTLAGNSPILFSGYGVADNDVRQIMYEAADRQQGDRPRYYACREPYLLFKLTC
jgi:hypothetical protein